MKAPMAIVVLAVAGGAVAVCRGQVDWRQPFPNVTSVLDTNLGIIFRGRVELEMRRTGGPRPSVVMGILEDAPLPDGRTWTREALAACDQGLVRCSDVLKVFDRLQAKGGRTAPVFGPRDRGLIEEAAEREALSQEKRDDLYRRALARGGATEGTVSESQGGAGSRGRGVGRTCLELARRPAPRCPVLGSKPAGSAPRLRFEGTPPPQPPGDPRGLIEIVKVYE